MKHTTLVLVALLVVLAAAGMAPDAVAGGPRDPERLHYVKTGVPEDTAVFEEADDTWKDLGTYGTGWDYLRDVSKPGLLTSFKRLWALVQESEAFEAEPNGERLGQALSDTLGKVIAILERPGSAPMEAVTPFYPQGRFGGPIRSDLIFFEGTNSQIVLSREANPEHGEEDEWVYYATSRQAVEVRRVCGLVENIFAEVRREPFIRVTARLAAIDAGWTNYLENGYSQYPWESLVNSRITPRLFGAHSWDKPPSDQIVLLHPELCALVDVRSREEASAGSAVLVHGVGYIHYFGDRRGWFLGLSLSAAMNDEDSSLAYGATVHFDHTSFSSRIPHISVGFLWPDADDVDDGPVVAVAVDFWRLLDSGGAEDLFRSTMD